MDRKRASGGTPTRHVTIKDLAAELDLSITTISRALGGYSDVGEATRERVFDAARRLGYRPNRNAQRLVTQRTHNIAWVQPDDDLKFLDPHFLEVLGGALRGARAGSYDIVLASHTPEEELEAYDRYVKDRSVDGFIVDLPRENDPRITYLLDVGRPFVVHGREGRYGSYGWVDVSHYESFYRLARLLLANGHRHIAFINGDERFFYARHRRRGIADAITDSGLSPDHLVVYNSPHPLSATGFQLTLAALRNPAVTAVVYSSILMAIEGFAALQQSSRSEAEVALATMDDELHYLDLSQLAGRLTFIRTSLRDAGVGLIDELRRQCDGSAPPSGRLIPIRFDVHANLDATDLDRPLPAHRRSFPN